jgi:hypothetical protein
VIPFGNFSTRKGGFQKKDIALFFKLNRLDIIVDQHKKHKLIRILSTGPMPGHGPEVAGTQVKRDFFKRNSSLLFELVVLDRIPVEPHKALVCLLGIYHNSKVGVVFGYSFSVR